MIDFLPFVLGILICGIRSTVLMRNVSDNDIRLIYHPFVSMGDGIPWRDVFKWGIDDEVKSAIFFLRILWVFGWYIGSDEYQFRLRMFFFEFLGAVICETVKMAVLTEKKFNRGIAYPLFQKRSNFSSSCG